MHGSNSILKMNARAHTPSPTLARETKREGGSEAGIQVLSVNAAYPSQTFGHLSRMTFVKKLSSKKIRPESRRTRLRTVDLAG